MQNAIIERLKKEIESLGSDKKSENIGIVRAVGDGIVEIEGLEGASMAEMVVFDEASQLSVKDAVEREGSLYGVILNLEEDTLKAIILGEASRIQEGMHVRGTGKVLSVPVGEAI